MWLVYFSTYVFGYLGYLGYQLVINWLPIGYQLVTLVTNWLCMLY